MELGRAWSLQAILELTTLDPVGSRRPLVPDHIDEALGTEWRRRFHSVAVDRFLYNIFERVGEPWMAEDAYRFPRAEIVRIARLMTGNCHLDEFRSLREDHSVVGPSCGEHFLSGLLVLPNLCSRFLGLSVVRVLSIGSSESRCGSHFKP